MYPGTAGSRSRGSWCPHGRLRWVDNYIRWYFPLKKRHLYIIEIEEIQAHVVFGDIFLFFIVFDGPRLRSLVFTRCATRNDDFGSQNHFFTALCETGPWSLQKGRGPSDGVTPKRGPKKQLMGSNWFKKKIWEKSI